MKKRQDTKAQDIEKLYEVLESAAAHFSKILGGSTATRPK